MPAPAVRRDPAGLLILAATLLFVCQIGIAASLVITYLGATAQANVDPATRSPAGGATIEAPREQPASYSRRPNHLRRFTEIEGQNGSPRSPQ